MSGYQGWAPGTTEFDDVAVAREEEPREASQYPNEVVSLIRGLFGDNATRRHRREQEAMSRLAQSRRSPDDQEDMDWQATSSYNDTSLSSARSLRTAAILQSVQRQANAMQLAPRAGSFSEEDIRHRPLRYQEAWAQRHSEQHHEATRNQQTRSQTPTGDDTRRTERTRRIDRYAPETEGAKWLEKVIKYLERIRTCESPLDRTTSAIAGGLYRGLSCGGFVNIDQDDFVLDTSRITPPQPTSWLCPGGLFSGSQRASTNFTPPLPQYNIANIRRRDSSSTIRSQWMNRIISQASPAKNDDSWPVKVTISSIDYDSMTLTGTMEAFNVPNKNSPTKGTSITTYLEGEIIDFNKYTLQTKSFNADSEVDTTYWRKLEPFRSLDDKELVSNLVSMKWLSEDFSQKWILMRWKGKNYQLIFFFIKKGQN
jgi:hypothetical protein